MQKNPSNDVADEEDYYAQGDDGWDDVDDLSSPALGRKASSYAEPETTAFRIYTMKEVQTLLPKRIK